MTLRWKARPSEAQISSHQSTIYPLRKHPRHPKNSERAIKSSTEYLAFWRIAKMLVLISPGETANGFIP